MIKVLVIGSGGMLGHMTTTCLRENGFDVEDISRSRKCSDRSLLIDVLDGFLFKDYLDKNEFDWVINCAAILPKPAKDNPSLAIKLNAVFPYFLEEMLRKKRTRIINVSTAGVYGSLKEFPDEESPHLTDSIYGKTKSLGEVGSDKVLNVRSDFWGPDMFESGTGLFNFALKETEKILGYSKAYFNGVSSLEFSKFVISVINHDYSGSYNLHSSNIVSKSQFLKDVNKVYDRKIQVNEVDNISYNTAIMSCRRDIAYENKTFYEQIIEIKKWTDSHKYLYEHYYKG